MPARSFGPFTSDGIPVPAGARVQLRVIQTSGIPRDLAKLRFGVAQLEPKGSGGLLLPATGGGGIEVPEATHVYSVSSDNTARKLILGTASQVWSYDYGNSLFAVAVDQDGFLYIGGDNDSVVKIDPDGNEVWTNTDPTDRVQGVAVDQDGNVYTGSRDNTVHKIDPDGNEVWTYTGHSNDIYGVAVDQDGNVYTASRDNTLHKIDSDGSHVWTFTGHSSHVRHVAVDADGFVYTAGSDDTVRKLDPGGGQEWSYDIGTYGLSVAVDHEGFVYAGVNGSVRKLDPDGDEVWQSSGDAPTTTQVAGVAVDHDQMVYAGDWGNTVRQLDQDGDQQWIFEDHSGNVGDVAVGAG